MTFDNWYRDTIMIIMIMNMDKYQNEQIDNYQWYSDD